MKLCVKCGQKAAQTIDSRGVGKITFIRGVSVLVRRRHECTACGERFTTYEISDTEFKRLCSALAVVYETIPSLMKRIKELNKDQ